MIAYYYLHTNGDLIYKKFRPEDDSSFVRRIWELNLEERESAWILCSEALALGARRERVFELKDKWDLTDDDGQEFAKRVNLRLYMDGDMWCATFDDFVDLQESEAGFGKTALEALAELAKGGLCPGQPA